MGWRVVCDFCESIIANGGVQVEILTVGDVNRVMQGFPGPDEPWTVCQNCMLRVMRLKRQIGEEIRNEAG